MRIAAVLFVILVLLVGIMPCTAQDKPEFRAMWVSSYGPGLLTPAQIDDTVRAAKAANVNALILQVRKTGDAYYKSAYEPRGENIPDPNFDPLDYMVRRCHQYGIECHAWINTYKVWAGTTPPKSPDHVFNKHPEWINRNIDGRLDKSGQYGLDPGIPEVQQHLFNVYMDVIKKYDVDGIHFDYCRYWSPDFGYSKIAVDRFNKEMGRTGIPAMDDKVWCDWRRDRVTSLVRQVYQGAQKIKPWVKVTGSVVCSQPCTAEFKDSHPYNLLLQDWERWLHEGIIDAVTPMNYKPESDPELAKQFRDWIDGMVKWRHGRHVYNGITVSRNVDEFATQVAETRKRGADGYAGFDFGPSRGGGGNRNYTRNPLAGGNNGAPQNFGGMPNPNGQQDRGGAPGLGAPNVGNDANPGGMQNRGGGPNAGGAPDATRRSYFNSTPRLSRDALAIQIRQKINPTWVPTPVMPWKAQRPAKVVKPAEDAEQLLDSAYLFASRGGSVDKTIEMLKHVVIVDPNYADAHYRLGQFYAKKGMKQQAVGEFQYALLIDPKHAGAKAGLGK